MATEVVHLAHRVFEDAETANRWLQKPNHGLEGERPWALLRTGPGANLVRDVVLRVEHGRLRVIVWRIHAAGRHPLDGTGAALAGGSWNRPGTPAVYTSTHLSLAALKRLQYHDPGDAPRRLESAEVEIPDDAVVAIDPLPDGWERFPHSDATREAGEGALSADGSLGLLVPSAAFAPPEMNVVLNPRHADFAAAVRAVSTQPFVYSPRLG